LVVADRDVVGAWCHEGLTEMDQAHRTQPRRFDGQPLQG